MEMTEIILTADGSHTLFVPELNEHYHSVHGAIQESEFIFINNGFVACKADPVNILEIGFGTGLNAFLTALKSCAGTRKVHYTSVEKYPLPEEITDSLNYHIFKGEDTRKIFYNLHSSPWNSEVTICDNFILKKIESDITNSFPDGSFDLIYFDAFGPDKQPEMWNSEIFKKIADSTREDGVFITYSAKGEVKRKLRSNGFIVTMLPGPPGKRQIIRADKKAN
ncbi:MAG TPA: tRNA (5-methylaminomethyl-2-thiouridine)(34)-methyltransferase MnmD [Bacteroidales bacterium]|nr:tRNA (5-methylaminomethyl-2-thiouridine)(34)-methyltransferase MnmD [Bacteroidales bacterium]